MRLRESILTSIRTAVDGFDEQIEALQQPLLEPGRLLVAGAALEAPRPSESPKAPQLAQLDAFSNQRPGTRFLASLLAFSQGRRRPPPPHAAPTSVSRTVAPLGSQHRAESPTEGLYQRLQQTLWSDTLSTRLVRYKSGQRFRPKRLELPKASSWGIVCLFTDNRSANRKRPSVPSSNARKSKPTNVMAPGERREPQTPSKAPATTRRVQRPIPPSMQTVRPYASHFPAEEPGSASSSPPTNAPDPSYTRGLEAQLGLMGRAVHTLETRLTGYAARNRELENVHTQIARNRAQSDREVAQRAAELIRAAECRASELVVAAEQRADALQREARARSFALIEAVSSEIDQLEREARQLRTASGQADDAATGRELVVVPDAPPVGAQGNTGRDPAHLRGEISDLLRLRESILVSVRRAVDGFSHELDALSGSLLVASDEEPAAEGDDALEPRRAASSPTANGSAAETGIEVHIESVSGVLEASRLEQRLAEGEAEDVHLRSVEGGSAVLRVTGLGLDDLRRSIASRFPGSETEPVDDDRILMRLEPAQSEAG